VELYGKLENCVLGVDEERKLYLKASIFSGVGFARHV
jgi:hypothetical protein